MNGIDVSVYQGEIDWETVSKQVDFAYIKAGQGINNQDLYLQKNAQEVAKTNLKFGYYHFATLNQQDVFNDAKQEADYFLNQLKDLPKASLSPTLDIELNNTLNLTPDKVENWIHAFVSSMKNDGYNIILYSYKAFLDTNLPKNHTLGSLPLWIAQYSSNSFPVLPNGFKSYNIWQKSDKGKLEGISGFVDLNVSRILI